MNGKECFATCFGLLLLAAVLASPAACTANRHNQIRAAIEAGADPLEAKCAIEASGGPSELCAIAATKSKEKGQ